MILKSLQYQSEITMYIKKKHTIPRVNWIQLESEIGKGKKKFLNLTSLIGWKEEQDKDRNCCFFVFIGRAPRISSIRFFFLQPSVDALIQHFRFPNLPRETLRTLPSISYLRTSLNTPSLPNLTLTLATLSSTTPLHVTAPDSSPSLFITLATSAMPSRRPHSIST